jgi:ribosomal protein S18 acetylase RimI-like enzyme
MSYRTGRAVAEDRGVGSAAGMPALRIVEGSARDIPALEPLWVGVHHVHAASMPELAPYVSDAETWAERRALYESLFEKPDTVLVLALDGDELVGYALAHVLPPEETWIGDTWHTGQRIAEIESLAVSESHRGRGIGSRLLDRIDEMLEANGIRDVFVGALAGNEGALRLYERRGFRPTWLYLSRFDGR